MGSWFFCDAKGVFVLRLPEGPTIGKNYAWRSYFHGGPRDRDETWRPAPGERLPGTSLSEVFRSQDTSAWIVAISTPVFDTTDEKNFLGVLAMTVEVGRFVELRGENNELSPFAVLVDNREGDHKGLVLQHPLFDKLLRTGRPLPDRIKTYRINADDLPDDRQREENYRDPLAADPEGGDFDRPWLARMEQVRVGDKDTGWIVIVQEAYDSAIGETLDNLTRGLVRSGAIALGLIALVMAGLWGMAKRLSGTA